MTTAAECVEPLACPPPPEQPEEGRGYRIAGWALMGVGVAAGVGSAYFGIEARQEADDALASNGGDVDAFNRHKQNAYDYQTVAVALGVVAGATVVTGGILYYLGVEDTPASGLLVAPGGGGATLLWQMPLP
jgi:hypothetical protein